MLYDRTQQAALLQKRRNWNPLYHLWTGWQHFAYFFCPPGENPCIYCWLCRMFFVGVLCGVLGHVYWPWN